MNPDRTPKTRSVWPTLWVKIVHLIVGLNRNFQASWASQRTGCLLILQLQTVHCRYAVVTCEIKLFWNDFKNISVFYFTCNHVWNWNKITSAAEIISKLFQRHSTCWKMFMSCNAKSNGEPTSHSSDQNIWRSLITLDTEVQPTQHDTCVLPVFLCVT